MKASVGDHVVIASNVIDRPVRDGEIVEVRGRDGQPPYVVRWADSGKTGLVFPGVDAHVEHRDAETRAEADPPARPLKTWQVRVDLVESGDETTAHAVLASESPEPLDASGRARRHPADPHLPEVGDEVAVARALHRLADRLLAAASSDLAAVTNSRVSLTR